MKTIGAVLAIWAAVAVIYNLLPKHVQDYPEDHPRPFFSGKG